MQFWQKGMVMANEKYIDLMEVFQGKDDQWYYRAKSNNGEILFTSEGYKEKRNATDYAVWLADQHEVSVEVHGG